MSDSAANQADYPQHGNQAEGGGWTIAKLVVFFSLLTGAVALKGSRIITFYGKNQNSVQST